MKNFVKYAVAILFVAALVLGIFAAEGDYGYYDRNEDGDISAIDVMMIVKDLVNGTDSDTTLLKAIKALKISASAEKVTFALKAMDYETSTATLFFNDNETIMTFAQLGFDKLQFIDLYEEGFVTLTVPAEVKNYSEKLDPKDVYAVKPSYRYDTTVLECTVGSTKAVLGGEEIPLSAAPVVTDSTLMIDASVLNSYFEADIEASGYVSAKEVADNLGMKLSFDEESGNITLIRQFYPTIVLGDVTVAAGGEAVVTVSVKHNTGFAGLEYRINYSSKSASYVSGKANTNSFYSSFSPTAGANPVKAVHANLSLKDIVGDVSLANITFKVADSAQSGEYLFTISDVKCYDSKIIEIKTNTQNGVLTVE